ncbi:MAG: hypothetical protein NZ602_09990 [Thermoguttaceae bacterium]|nr:hypothetical protein [Thermoguttaceae bacterium]MDW8038126.1 hypothetical protein [Thermoguttaceae bacterium]
MAKVELRGCPAIGIWAVSDGFWPTGSYPRHFSKTGSLGILGHLGRKPPFIIENAFSDYLLRMAKIELSATNNMWFSSSVSVYER